MTERQQLYREWFAGLPIRDRIRIMPSACCANPNPVLDEDCDGKPIVRCSNCSART